MAKANYTIETVGGFVLLEDLGSGMSITSDAEKVVAQLVAWGSLDGGQRILYRDTEGVWDELRHKEGRFVGFASVGAKTREAALEQARRQDREQHTQRTTSGTGRGFAR